MKNICTLMAMLVITGTILTGCSVLMAIQQPDKKDIALFAIGTPRSMLLAEFGIPFIKEKKNGKTYEIFRFTQGYSVEVKAGRAVLHGTADVLTWGLWEVVGTPIEGILDGDNMAFEVSYDKNDRIDSVLVLKSQNKTSFE